MLDCVFRFAIVIIILANAYVRRRHLKFIKMHDKEFYVSLKGDLCKIGIEFI